MQPFELYNNLVLNMTKERMKQSKIKFQIIKQYEFPFTNCVATVIYVPKLNLFYIRFNVFSKKSLINATYDRLQRQIKWRK